jgi:hypothetical protein
MSGSQFPDEYGCRKAQFSLGQFSRSSGFWIRLLTNQRFVKGAALPERSLDQILADM